MYFGSVKFYKHLILIIVVLTILILSFLCFKFKRENHQLIAENNDFKNIYENNLSDNNKLNFPYQKMYPDLYVTREKFHKVGKGTVYLTFDDGPSPLTVNILDTLKEKNIKATFFVIYKDDEVSKAIYKRIVDEGHTIGVHSTTHDYDKIYKDVTSFLQDFEPVSNLIEETTGVKPTIFRFPGGSINIYNADIYEEIIAEMIRRGYLYYDWNASSGDAKDGATVDSIFNKVVNKVHTNNVSIVLMHDSGNKFSTASALPHIIDTLTAEGYKFKALNHRVQPITFNYDDMPQ